MIEDMALMRVLPNMRVLVPADYASAKVALRLAAETYGPVYIRMGRANVDQIEGGVGELGFGKARVLREGTDVSIIACGVEVGQALLAAKMLEEKGVQAEVIDAFSIKPLDAGTILNSARKTGFVVTAEEHSVIGGLGEAVAGLLSEYPGILNKPFKRIGVQDRFGTSGEFDELFREYGLDAQAIYDVVVQ
jgi:transketolase